MKYQELNVYHFLKYCKIKSAIIRAILGDKYIKNRRTLAGLPKTSSLGRELKLTSQREKSVLFKSQKMHKTSMGYFYKS